MRRTMVTLQQDDFVLMFGLKKRSMNSRMMTSTIVPGWVDVLTEYRPKPMCQMAVTSLRTNGVIGTTQLICTRSDRQNAIRGESVAVQQIERVLAERRDVLNALTACDAAEHTRKQQLRVRIAWLDECLRYLCSFYHYKSYMRQTINVLVQRQTRMADEQLVALAKHFAANQDTQTSDSAFGLSKATFQDIIEHKPLTIGELRQGNSLPERLLASGLLDGAKTLGDALCTASKLLIGIDTGVTTLATCVAAQITATIETKQLVLSLRGQDAALIGMLSVICERQKRKKQMKLTSRGAQMSVTTQCRKQWRQITMCGYQCNNDVIC